MHIVLISREFVSSLRGGGIASYMKEMADGYVQLGHAVTVICASDDTRLEDDNVKDEIRVIRLSKGDFINPSIEGKNLIKKLRCMYRFYSYRKKIKNTLLKLQNVDIVEVPEFGAEGYYLNNMPFPIVTRLHTPTFLDRQTFKKKKYPITLYYEYWCALKEEHVLKRADYITSCSKSLKEWVHQYFDVDINKIEVIYNPIQTQQWDRAIVSKFQEPTINILFVGTVIEPKGIGDLIEACKIIIAQGKPVNLTIAGKLGRYGEQLKQLMINESWCKFLGNVPRNNLSDIYLSNEIACFPSWWEAFGIICIEAMLSACLVIGSNSGGMIEIIEDGKDGFLLPPQNPQLLAEKIIEVYSLSDLEKATIKQNAKAKVNQRFSTVAVTNQMLQYYQNVISQMNRQ